MRCNSQANFVYGKNGMLNIMSEDRDYLRLKEAKFIITFNSVLLRESKIVEGMRYITNNLFPDLEEVMIGASKSSEIRKLPGEIVGAGSVVEELKTFGKECK